MMKEVAKNYNVLLNFGGMAPTVKGPNGKKQVYEWHRFEQPCAALGNWNTAAGFFKVDIGPGNAWVGNESGIAGDPNWNTLDTLVLHAVRAINRYPKSAEM